MSGGSVGTVKVGVSSGQESDSGAGGMMGGLGAGVDDEGVGGWQRSTMGCKRDVRCNSQCSESDPSESESLSESKLLSSRSRSTSRGGNCTISGACGKSWVSVE